MTLIVEMTGLGGPENLVARDIDLPAPAAGEVRLRHTAIGFNYLDVYLRQGVYPVALPAVLGVEAAGVVTAVGDGVTDVRPGDRVAYAGPTGAYASERNIAARHLVPIPDGVSNQAAAALIFKGLTAHMLVRRVHRVAAGDTVLVHAAAGGVGQILSRWSKALGATVVGTVGSEAKVAAARTAGADHVAVLGRDDVDSLVRTASGGVGAAVAYDSIGRDTMEVSLSSLRPFGIFASFGQASGEVPPISAGQLRQHGSAFFVRPTIYHHIADTGVYRAAAAELFALLADGTLSADISATYALPDAAHLHHLAQTRQTVGSVLLIP